MSGGSTVWSSTLIRIMSSLFMAVPSRRIRRSLAPDHRFENYLLPK
jgi:hypothetical protein